MEVNPVSYIEIILNNTPELNEVLAFKDIIEKCIKEAIKPGFIQAFTDNEKTVLASLAKGLNIELDKSTLIVLTGDTHTTQQFNEQGDISNQ